MDLLRDKTFVLNPTKSNLKEKGFRYDMIHSTKDYECYSYSFVLERYNRTPLIIATFRIYLDNGEVTIDVNYDNGCVYPAWYQRNDRLYTAYKDHIKRLDQKIINKMKKLGIIDSNKDVIVVSE